jgi:hypothetical protein
MSKISLPEQIERARYHVIALFRWGRVLGLLTTGVVLYFVVFVVLGQTDVGWMLPKVVRHIQWPDLPHFFVSTQKTPDGRDEAVYTVPSRQLTPQELAQLTSTNAAPATAPSAR